MFKGSIYVTTDINVAIQASCASKIIIMGDPNVAAQQIPNAIIGTTFVPPYQVMISYLDGNIQGFVQQYTSYLTSPEVMSYIANILMALRKGVNIMIYLNIDEFGMYFGTFSQFIYSAFGITIGSNNTPFGFLNLPQYKNETLSLLYLNDLITAKELFMEFDQTMFFSDFVIMKLCEEFQPTLDEGNTLEVYRKYFYDKLIKIKMTNRYIENPIRRVPKC